MGDLKFPTYEAWRSGMTSAEEEELSRRNVEKYRQFMEREEEYDALLARETARQEEEAEAARVARDEELRRQGRWVSSPHERVRVGTPPTWFTQRFLPPASALRPADADAAARPATTPVPPEQTYDDRFGPMEAWDPPLPDCCFTERQKPPHPMQKKYKVMDMDARMARHDRFALIRKNLFEGDEEEEDVNGGQYDDEPAHSEMPLVSMQDVLAQMTAAQARRRYVPSWVFIAYDMDRVFFDECLQFYFVNKYWPPASHIPAQIRLECREADIKLQELYVQEPFAPLFVTVAKEMKKEWFEWMIDCFFADGFWPRFDELPEAVRQECLRRGIGPDDLD